MRQAEEYDNEDATTPDDADLREWMLAQGIDPEEDKLTIVLKRTRGANRGIIGKFTQAEMDQCDFDAVGRECGPGTYQWMVTTKGGGTKSVTRTLAPDRYAAEHRAYRATMDGIPQGAAQGSAGDIGSVVEKQMEQTIKMLSAVREMNPLPPVAVDKGETTAMMMQMMLQQAQQQQQMMLEASKSNMTMVLGMMQMMGGVMSAAMSKPSTEQDPMKLFSLVMESAKQIADVKTSLLPPEKESVAERLVGMVSENLPAVLQVVTMRAEEREKSIKYKLVQGLPEVQQANADPALQQQTAELLARKLGLVKARDICGAMGWSSVVEQMNAVIRAKAPQAVPAPPQEPLVEPMGEGEGDGMGEGEEGFGEG